MTKGKGWAKSLVLVFVLAAVLALVGCGGGSETKVTADEVVQDALAAQANVHTGHVEINIVADAEGTLSGNPLDASLNATLTADIDWANKKMKADLGMNANYNGLSFPISMGVFAVDNCSYIQTQFGTMTDNWTRAEFPMDFWQGLTSNQTIDINSILQNTDAESLPDQKVNGINCYVVQLKPDISAIQATLSGEAGYDEDMPDIENLIKSLTIKVWVARDTSYVTKMEMTLSAHVTGEAVGQLGSSDVLDVNFSITVLMTDVNKAVTIEVPAEAENAEWGNPLDMFSGFGF
ncbi:MAG: hypothetical protein QUS33_12225 [Dehalococcoidia bacterium]|nr:hypothetical protein [Dehalococcoidia bacterium]